MADQLINFYVQKILQIRRDKNAPHKPLLLMTIIDVIEKDGIENNQIFIDANFIELFKINTKALVIDYPNEIVLSYPLRHLQSDGFWSVLMKEGRFLKSYLGEKSMQTKIAYGQLDQAFFELLQNQEYRDLFRMVILDSYFPTTKITYFDKNNFPEELKNLNWDSDEKIFTLEEPQPVYETKHINRVVEGFKRDWKFRRNVLSAYNQTCCISDFTIYNQNVSFIEACHIQWHHLTGKNAITNGIALNSMLHDAFDEGFFTITKDYKVKISKQVTENDKSPFRLKQFDRMKINLPKTEIYYPSLESLEWHEEVIFKK
jgi:putative restriction endonuclease